MTLLKGALYPLILRGSWQDLASELLHVSHFSRCAGGLCHPVLHNWRHGATVAGFVFTLPRTIAHPGPDAGLRRGVRVPPSGRGRNAPWILPTPKRGGWKPWSTTKTVQILAAVGVWGQAPKTNSIRQPIHTRTTRTILLRASRIMYSYNIYKPALIEAMLEKGRNALPTHPPCSKQEVWICVNAL